MQNTIDNQETGQFQRTEPSIYMVNLMAALTDPIAFPDGVAIKEIDCVITSPPYFQQVDYSVDGQYGLEDSVEEYIWNQKVIFNNIFQRMNNGACCWVVIADTVNNYSPVRNHQQRKNRRQMKPDEKISGWSHRRPLQWNYSEKEQLDIPFHFIQMMREIGYVHRNTLIWDKGQSGVIPQNTDTAPACHEYILQFGKWTSTGRPMLKCKGLPDSVIQINAVSHPEHPAPFPEKLVNLLMFACTEPGDLVFDPYVGTGTTCLAAFKHHRRSIGIDLDIQLAHDRIRQWLSTEEARQQSLPI